MVDLFCYLEYYFYIVAVWDYSGNFLYAEAIYAIFIKFLNSAVPRIDDIYVPVSRIIHRNTRRIVKLPVPISKNRSFRIYSYAIP